MTLIYYVTYSKRITKIWMFINYFLTDLFSEKGLISKVKKLKVKLE